MRIKVKIFKRIISLLCVISMTTLSMINSVGAIDTMEGAEAAFSMAYMNCLPKKGKADFNKFSGKFERGKAKDKFYGKLQEEKLYENVKYSDGFNGFKNNDVIIKEKEVYEKIKETVKELKDKVDERTPKHKKYSGKSSKNLDKSRSWRIAKAIYRWVAKTIKYDYDSLKEEHGRSLRKPQDPLFVFDQKMGVCVGKANLINLMMRLAGIPSVVIVSETHAFNAIYLKDKNNPNRTGWTLIDVTWGSPESDMEIQTRQKEKTKNIEEMLKMSEIPFVEEVEGDLTRLNRVLFDRINKINRPSNRGKLKNSKEYGKEFRVFCENLFDDNKDELKNNVNTVYSILLQYLGQEHRATYLEKESMKQARKRVGDIVEDMNKKIESEIVRLNSQYKDIAKIGHFKINFSEDRLVTNNISKLLFASMEVDLSSKEAKKIEEKFSYWSDKMKEFFPGFYDKTLSFKCANEDIIDKCAHKIEQMFFGDRHDLSERHKDSVFNLIIDGVTYKRLIDKGAFRGIKLIGDENRSLENVKISPDMANFEIQFEIGHGIRSLILQGNEIIDWSSVGSLESVDITESNRYMVENGVLYWKKDGSKGDKVNVPKQIQFVNQKDNRRKIEMAKDKLFKQIEEYRKRFKDQNTEYDAKVEKINNEMTQRYDNIGNNLTNKDVAEVEEFIRKSIKKIQSFKEKCLFNQNTELKKANEKFYSWAKSRNIDSREYEKLEDRKNKTQEKNEMIEDKTIQDIKSNKKIIKRIVKKKGRKSKKVDENIVQRKEIEEKERLEREKKEKERLERQKREKEEKERLERQKLENDKKEKKKKIIKRIVKKKGRKSKKVDENIVQRKEIEEKERLEREKREKEAKEKRENEKNKEKNKDKDMASGIFTMLDKVNKLSKREEEAKRNGVWSAIKKSLIDKVNKLSKEEAKRNGVWSAIKKSLIDKVNKLSKEEAKRNGVWSIVKRFLETSERIAYIKGDIEKEQNDLRYQNSRNAQNRFMQLACLKSDIENIENELKNERFKDNNELKKYEDRINKFKDECELLGVKMNENIKKNPTNKNI